MTYGDVASRLRDTMIWLLERRRITQQLGGPGSFRVPVTTTEADRLAMGEEIQRYRAAVLTYCLEAVRAVTPTADLDGKDRLRDPAVALRHQLEVARAAMPADTQLSSLMMQRPHFELVSRWQDAARIAIEGEREIAAIRRQPLSREQQAQVLKDAADLARGLVVLDIRYKNVPGWRFLEQKGRLMTAATAVSERLEHPVGHIDRRPRLATHARADRRTRPAGTCRSSAGAAQRRRRPEPLPLGIEPPTRAGRTGRRVEAGRSSRRVHRALACRTLHRTRRVVPRARSGQPNGRRRTGRRPRRRSREQQRCTPTAGVVRPRGSGLVRRSSGSSHLGDRVDARIATAVEHGFQEKLYFVAFTLPCLDTHARDGIFRPAQKWIPVASTSQTELLALTRERLRPVQPPVVTAPAVSAQGRAAYDAVLRLGRGNAPRCSPRR